MAARAETVRKHALRRVERASASLDIAREAQAIAFLAGKQAGLTLRDLAEASGVAPETVRRALQAMEGTS